MIWESIARAAWQMHWAEIASVLAGIVYVILAARENIWCWLFGIVGSALSIYLFFVNRLYAESFLYFYYVLAGIYGWWAWTHDRDADDEKQMSITTWAFRRHAVLLLLGIGLSFLLAWFLQRYTDALMPLIDAHTTVFSFIATYLVTRKVLSNWIYWVFIDAVSVGLYANRQLYLYALLMVAYTVIAVWGYIKWRSAYKEEQAGHTHQPA